MIASGLLFAKSGLSAVWPVSVAAAAQPCLLCAGISADAKVAEQRQCADAVNRPGQSFFGNQIARPIREPDTGCETPATRQNGATGSRGISGEGEYVES